MRKTLIEALQRSFRESTDAYNNIDHFERMEKENTYWEHKEYYRDLKMKAIITHQAGLERIRFLVDALTRMGVSDGWMKRTYEWNRRDKE